MTKLTILFTLTAVAMLIAGCGMTYTYKPGVTIAQAEQDWQDCYADAIEASQWSWSSRQELAMDYYITQAEDCMRQKGYREFRLDKLQENIVTKTGVADTIAFAIAADPAE